MASRRSLPLLNPKKDSMGPLNRSISSNCITPSKVNKVEIPNKENTAVESKDSNHKTKRPSSAPISRKSSILSNKCASSGNNANPSKVENPINKKLENKEKVESKDSNHKTKRPSSAPISRKSSILSNKCVSSGNNANPSKVENPINKKTVINREDKAKRHSLNTISKKNSFQSNKYASSDNNANSSKVENPIIEKTVVNRDHSKASRHSLSTICSKNSIQSNKYASSDNNANPLKMEIPINKKTIGEDNNKKPKQQSLGAISKSSILTNSDKNANPSKVELPSSYKTGKLVGEHNNKTNKRSSSVNITKNFIVSNISNTSIKNIKKSNVNKADIPTKNNFLKKPPLNTKNNTSDKNKEFVVSKSSSAANVQKKFLVSTVSTNNIDTSKVEIFPSNISKRTSDSNFIASNKACVSNDKSKSSEENMVKILSNNNVTNKRSSGANNIEFNTLRKSTNEINPHEVEISTSSKTVEFVCREIGPNTIKIVEKIPQKDTYGRTELHLLCGRERAAKLIDYNTELLTLRKRKQIEALTEIIESGVDINAVDWTNNTPLHEAVGAGQEDFVELLLKSGALINVRDDDYDTPLHRACQLNNIPMVTLLLKYGADKNAINSLCKSVMNVKCTHMRQLLQQTTSNINILPVFYIHRSHDVFISEVNQKTKDFLVSRNFCCFPVSPRDFAFCVIGENQNIHHVEVLQAILKGIMVLRECDLQLYLSKPEVIQPKLIPEEIRSAVLKSIKNVLSCQPKLFDRLNFYISSHFSSSIKFHDVDFSVSHLSFVIKEGGGQTLIRAPTERNSVVPRRPYHMRYSVNSDTNFIVYDKRYSPLTWNDKNNIRHVITLNANIFSTKLIKLTPGR